MHPSIHRVAAPGMFGIGALSLMFALWLSFGARSEAAELVRHSDVSVTQALQMSAPSVVGRRALPKSYAGLLQASRQIVMPLAMIESSGFNGWSFHTLPDLSLHVLKDNTIPIKLAPPVLLRAETLESSYRITWSAAEGTDAVNRYILERKELPDGDWLALAIQIPPDQFEYENGENVRYSREYTFRLAAIGELTGQTEWAYLPGVVPDVIEKRLDFAFIGLAGETASIRVIRKDEGPEPELATVKAGEKIRPLIGTPEGRQPWDTNHMLIRIGRETRNVIVWREKFKVGPNGIPKRVPEKIVIQRMVDFIIIRDDLLEEEFEVLLKNPD